MSQSSTAEELKEVIKEEILPTEQDIEIAMAVKSIKAKWKKTLKPKSKSELIDIIIQLSIDVSILKQELSEGEE